MKHRSRRFLPLYKNCYQCDGYPCHYYVWPDAQALHWQVQHGENPEHRRRFHAHAKPYPTKGYMEAIEDWLDEIHSL